MTARLLVTGFGPFPGIPRNPSAETARRVAAAPRWRRLGVDAHCLVLPTTYAALDAELEPALARLEPDAVLIIGVAGRARHVRLERRALNRASLLMADAEGHRPAAPALARGPAMRITRVAPAALRALLRRHIPCGISHNAGRYLCNAAYFRALAAPVPVVFVHMPKPPRRGRRAAPSPAAAQRSWQERLSAGLVEVALALLTEGRRGRARSRPRAPGL